MSHSGFELTDEAHSVFHRSLGIRAERPIAQTETSPDKVDQWIERQEELIAKITCKREPPHSAAAGYHHIEFVTMDNQDTFTGGGYVNCVLLDLDIPIRSAKARHQFIVISRNVNHPRTFAGFAQDFLDHVVVLLWPVDCASERPDINQVADDVEHVEVGLAQEVQQRSGITAACAQVSVGDPRGAIALWSYNLLPRSAERETLLRVDRSCGIASGESQRLHA